MESASALQEAECCSPATAPRPPVLVMAVGNILRRDDGFAESVLERLAGQELPDDVELFNAGTSAIDLMEIFNSREKLIVIDAVRGGHPPGTLYRFSPEQVVAEALPLNTLHQVGLLETLRLGELVDCRPKTTVIIGCQPQDTNLGIGLSPTIEAAVEQAATLVIQEIEAAGSEIQTAESP